MTKPDQTDTAAEDFAKWLRANLGQPTLLNSTSEYQPITPEITIDNGSDNL